MSGTVLAIASSAFLKLKVKKKVVPSPSSLSSFKLPPIKATNLAEIAKPSPVPPNFLLVLTSACENASNIFSCCSSLIPIPESSTENLIVVYFSLSATLAISTFTLPSTLVNLTALEMRLTIT